MRLGMQDLNFGWTIEMQIKAKVAQLKTAEVPVTYRRRIGVSKISGTLSGTVRAGYKILFTIAKLACVPSSIQPGIASPEPMGATDTLIAPADGNAASIHRSA